MNDSATTNKAKATLKTRFLSHGTLGSRNLEATRKFYEYYAPAAGPQFQLATVLMRRADPACKQQVLVGHRDEWVWSHNVMQ